jgi:hypothetical protein
MTGLHLKRLLAATACVMTGMILVAAGPGQAQTVHAGDIGDAMEASLPAADPAAGEADATIVTRENFVRAETDRMFSDIAGLAGGVNRFFIIRSPTPLDQQVVVRMNRDTLYSGAVIDASGGGTITLPPSPDGRYFSVHFMDNDHYDLGVIDQPGTHALPADSGHVFAAIRIQLYNPNDPDEIARVNAWQDELVIAAAADRPFVPGSWDKASLDAVRVDLEAGSRRFPNMEKAMLPRGEADAEQHLYGAACCWGLLPATEATYFNYSGGHSHEQCHTATFPVPANRAFWSITVYDETGFIAYENSVLNSSTVTLNPDGTFTAFFGPAEACGDKPNRLDTPPGWNTMMRVYRPDASVLNGGYVLPATTPVNP